ncbi:hypothetical protein KBH77_00470 [Patescibacteria group bacterium]|nr:hypothetical protein [Patescibacteria group bacterium]
MFYLINLFFVGFNFLYFYLINKNILNPNLIHIFIIYTSIYLAVYLIFFLFSIFVLNQKKEFIKNFAIYFIYVISSILFFIFIRDDNIKIVFYTINILLTFLNFLSFKSKLVEKDNYFTQEASYFTFLVSVFLFFSSIFAFYVFIGFNKLIILLLSFAYFYLLYYLLYSSSPNDKKNLSRYIFISTLTSSEFLFILTYLPYSYYVRAILILIFSFFISNFGKEALNNEVNKKYFNRAFITMVFLVIIVLISAKTS